MERTNYHYTQLVNELSKSRHGELIGYQPITDRTAENDPEFLSRFIAWNLLKGEIRDAKIAIPILSLRKLRDAELTENAVASLMALDPKSLVRAYRFNKALSADGENTINRGKRLFGNAIQEYILVREANKGWWDRTAIQHRNYLKELYAVSHMKPSPYAKAVLFEKKYPRGSIFEKIATLKSMPANEAAGVIINHKLPFQVITGALGQKLTPELILSFLETMTGQQLINSTNMLKTLGVFSNPILKAAYDKAISRAEKDKKVTTLKAGKAIKEVKDLDEGIVQRLEKLQEVKIEQKGGIEGDWVVLADKSGSMRTAIDLAKEISGLISRSVKGNVFLIFFDVAPRGINVKGMTLEQIKYETRFVTPNGGTSCGCGLSLLAQHKNKVDGIVLVSDGGDNTWPFFRDGYSEYAKTFEVEPNVYFFKVRGDRDVVSSQMDMTVFDMTQQVDYYSLPDIIATLRTKKWGLLDEIMATPLLTLDKVFKHN